MRVDLHLHSTASDGSLRADALVAQANAGGLHVIALADHDTTAGIGMASRAAAGTIHVIPSIEISTTTDGRELHMLGYFVDPGHADLVEHERNAVTRRRERMEAIIDSLGSDGLDIDMQEVEAAAAGARIVARPHLARVLVDRGHAHSVSDAFDRWIGDDCPAYRSIDLISPEDAIQLIHVTGGIAAWAHPDMASFDNDIARFADAGLDAIECFRPRCPHDDTMHLLGAVDRFGLMATGGSDWHGPWSGRLGHWCVGPEEIGAFLERGGI